VENISIDWVKAEEKPNRSQRVKGRDLIDLRIKIVELEKQLQNKLNTIEKISNEMMNLSQNISYYESFINQLDEILKRQKSLSIEEFKELKVELKNQLV